jgi:hypothetical protein
MKMSHLTCTFLLAAGCASSPSSSGPSIFPDTQIYGAVYAGGAAPGKVTIAAMNATSLTWTSQDPSVASVTGTATLGTVTSLKAGSTMIVASAGGQTMPLPITVNSYTAAQLTAGQSAFQAHNCASAGCHSGSGPDISPSDIGKHTDDQIVAAVTQGKNPEGGDVSIGAAAHSFALTGDATVGIAAYLRSLPPGTPTPDN